MTTYRLILALTAVATAALAACGGGGSNDATSSSAATQSVLVQTYITDSLATEYSKVWVTIKKISIVDKAGVELTLLDASAAPSVVNLASLASVGQLMSTVSIPTGVYGEIRVTLDNALQLVSLDGNTTVNAKFSATVGDFIWHLRNVEMDTSTTRQLVLDFDLAKFTYDPATGIVTPTIDAKKPDDAIRKFVRQQAEAKGTITAIDVAKGTITFDDARLGKGVIVVLGSDAVILDEATGKTTTLADLAVGQRIEVNGVVVPGATSADPISLTASVIHIERAEQPAAAAPQRGEGTVTAVNGNSITVSLAEANFLPGADSVVVDIATARLSHGQASDIVPGVSVEFRGTLVGTSPNAKLVATSFDVEGAPSEKEHKADPGHAFVSLKGAVATLNADGSFSVAVTQSERPFAAPGTYLVDPSKATYLEGNAACLVAGKSVKAVGSLVGTNSLLAKFISLKDCGAAAR